MLSVSFFVMTGATGRIKPSIILGQKQTQWNSRGFPFLFVGERPHTLSQFALTATSLLGLRNRLLCVSLLLEKVRQLTGTQLVWRSRIGVFPR